MPSLTLEHVPSREAFAKDYMCPRKPGLFPISDDLAHLRGLWTDKHLTAAAGGAQLEVEQQRAVGEGFGKGHRIPLAFGEVLRRMAAGDASLYLTTQVGWREVGGCGCSHGYFLS
jgi:hypothetical protein